MIVKLHLSLWKDDAYAHIATVIQQAANDICSRMLFQLWCRASDESKEHHYPRITEASTWSGTFVTSRYHWMLSANTVAGNGGEPGLYRGHLEA